jgi:ubiquinone/menaquinone biosynthesis C-methylase UbiE
MQHMMDRKKKAVQRQFERQAGAYARSASHARDTDLDLLIAHLNLEGADRVLDVATGTGFTAFALEPHVRRVVGLDLTIGMLAEARRLQARAAGVAWVVGDAEALPFAGGAFSVVTVRRAPHHFPRLEQAVAEMLRVLAPGGRVGIVDQTPPEDQPGLELTEELEALRDPSHVRALTVSAWRDLARRQGIQVTRSEITERRLMVEEWLDLAGSDTHLRQAVAERLGRATPEARGQIGYQADPPSFMKRWMILVGRKT